MSCEPKLIQNNCIPKKDDKYKNKNEPKKTIKELKSTQDTYSKLNKCSSNPSILKSLKEGNSEILQFKKNSDLYLDQLINEDNISTDKLDKYLYKDIDNNMEISLESSFENIEWSIEERILFPEIGIPISRSEFYSNWKNIINQQETPRTPQFKIQNNNSSNIMNFDTSESEDISCSISRSSSINSFPEIQKNLLNCQDFLYTNIEYNYNDYINERPTNQYQNIYNTNLTQNSPSLPIPSNILGRNRFDLLLSQWTNYFSNRNTFDTYDIEYATQFFMNLDNTTLATVTSSLIYIGQCARYTQLRKYNND